MSAQRMAWRQFADITANARAVAALSRLGITGADLVTRIGTTALRGETRLILLRLVPNDEQLLVFSATGAIAWLVAPRGPVGYHLLALDADPALGALFVAAFRERRELTIPDDTRATDARELGRDWLAGEAAEADSEHGGAEAAAAAARLDRILSTDFDLIEGAADPREQHLPAADAQILPAPTAAMAGPEPEALDVPAPGAADEAREVEEAEPPAAGDRIARRPRRVRGSATGELPPQVEVDTPFDVTLRLSGPGVTPAKGAAVFTALPDRDLEVQLLRRRNALLEPGEPDPLRTPLPRGSRTVAHIFRVRAPEPGPVEVELRITQAGVHLGTIPLRSVAVAAAAPAPAVPVATTIDASRYPQNWFLQITDGVANPPAGKRVLRYTLRGADGTDESWDTILNSDGLLAALYRDIERVWAGIAAGSATTEQKRTAWTEALADRGRRMFRDLLPLEAQRALWARRDDLRDILLSTNETEIPWEIVHVHDPDAPGEGFFLGERGLFRWLTGTVQRDAVRIDAPHAFVVAPTGGPAAAGDEADFVTQRMRAQRVDPADADRLTAALSTAKLSLFHFAGHAMIDDQVAPPLQQLILAQAGRYSVLDLERILPIAGRRSGALNGATVLLNACRSGVLPTSSAGFGTVFLRAGASVFIGTLWSIADDPAADFSLAFYGALLAAKSQRRRARLGSALAEAREAARRSGDPSWLAYAVYADPATTISLAL